VVGFVADPDKNFSGRTPLDFSERVAFNNHSATMHLRALRNVPFTPERVLALQGIPTEDSLEHPEAAGRYRRDDDAHTETDTNDTSWLLLHPWQTIRQAIAALHEYVARQSREQQETERLLAASPTLRGRFNHRQVALLLPVE
jgi:hypothetical protein